MTRFARQLGLLALMAVGTAPLAAQSSRLSYGGLLGLSFSKAGGEDIGGNSKLVIGTAVGAFATFRFGGALALEPQILMVDKGIKSEESGLSATAKLTYIQIPLLVKVLFPIGAPGGVTGFLFAGPGVAYRVGCRLTLAQGGNELAGDCDTDEETDALRSFDASAIVGLGADIGRATFSLRYDLGLSRLDQSADANDIKNRSILLLGGVRVRMNP
jgi:hypothetical protein